MKTTSGKTNKYVIAFDVASKSTGWAIVTTDKKLVKYGSFNLVQPDQLNLTPTQQYSRRIQILKKMLKPLLDPYLGHIEQVIFESSAVKSSTTLTLFVGIYFCMSNLLLGLSPKYKQVTPTAWQTLYEEFNNTEESQTTIFRGNKIRTTKVKSMTIASRFAGVFVDDDDAADAICIAMVYDQIFDKGTMAQNEKRQIAQRWKNKAKQQKVKNQIKALAPDIKDVVPRGTVSLRTYYKVKDINESLINKNGTLIEPTLGEIEASKDIKKYIAKYLENHNVQLTHRQVLSGLKKQIDRANKLGEKLWELKKANK